MIKSMTGFGKASGTYGDKEISVEIKTLNSKQADITVRLPNAYSQKEIDIRSLLSKRLRRGKIYCQINIENHNAELPVAINTDLALRYIEELQTIEKQAGISHSSDLIAVVSRMPDVVANKAEEVSDEEYEVVKSIIEKAAAALDLFRSGEGELLAKDFAFRINKILELMDSIKAFEDARIVKIRERLETEMMRYSEKLKVDENRFEQELIFYLEKLDITEEKIRLRKHCDYFLQTLNENTEEKGKKLGFVIQEMGREINTIGSKANDAGIQKLVVQMKDEAEKIKEQMMNIL